ncbi:SDR family NAD(P)-dependent oxidoreductase [Catalinimonas niigatensis]|uniref:SDR family NAD(P)-dependent oxidoreductase n=1 Tax=Catalinimonas niigatensis TaxID=1397264 RepID=UPI0026659644|nr:SDR family oxidoreductase [Catalinimonas niigatensis]WPP50325.1 SDR family oxidoreductase [Catalinimonas niigatensis]
MTSNTKTTLISGATSGFGREFVELFAQDGYNLILIARHEQDLQKVANEVKAKYPVCDVIVIAKDLSVPGSAQELYDEVKGKNLTVDVLINNAGFGSHGLFVETAMEREQKIMHLNMISLVELTKLFLKEMVSRNDGKILQLGSTVAFMPVPKMAVYAASKAFVLSFTEALQHELKDTNVTVTVLCPGAGDTEFFERADAEDTRIVQDTTLSDPAKVARDGYEALMSGDRRVVSGAKNKIQAFMSNFVPDSFLAVGMSKMMEDKS